MPRKSAAAMATPKPIFTAKRPPAPDGLPPDAAALWVNICAGLDPNYFTTGDMVLLEALCRADSQKRQCDALVTSDGPILPDGTPNPALKMSVTLAASMASLSGKLRLCKSATTRAESASLKTALHAGPKPWDTNPEAARYFS